MSNDNGNANKMVDTPRTDAVQDELLDQDTYTSWLEMSQTARQLERELNAANERIKRLEEALRRIANKDYRSTESQIAFNALKEDKP